MSFEIDMDFSQWQQQQQQEQPVQQPSYYAAGQAAAADPVVRQAALEVLSNLRGGQQQQQPQQEVDMDPMPNPDTQPQQYVEWMIRKQTREAVQQEAVRLQQQQMRMTAPSAIERYMAQKESVDPNFKYIKQNFMQFAMQLDPMVVLSENGLLLMEAAANHMIYSASRTRPRTPQGQPQIPSQRGGQQRQQGNVDPELEKWGFKSYDEFEAIKPGEWNDI